MNTQQAFIRVIICVIAISLGLYTGFKVAWTESILRMLGLVAFALAGFGTLGLSGALIRIIIPAGVDYDIIRLTNKHRYEAFKREIGSGKMAVINIVCVSLFIILLAGSGYWFFTSIKQFEQDQLSRFGQIQRVRIKEVSYVSKSRQAYFDYYLNGNRYSKSLITDSYQEGDSATIKFSIENPDIVIWEYNK